MSTVSVAFYLVVGQRFDKYGRKVGRPSVRTTKTKPDCMSDEIAVAITLELPESLFRRPNLQARISVPESLAPVVITPEIQQNIARVVQDQLGITLHLRAPEDDQH
jgi:hypothetical protein